MAEYRDEIVQVVQDLIRRRSINMPPTGKEESCQEYLADYLRLARARRRSVRARPGPGFGRASGLLAGRDYRNRPNVTSHLPGRGGGRSLLLTGHVDTVALGDNVWTSPPFGPRDPRRQALWPGHHRHEGRDGRDGGDVQGYRCEGHAR